MFPEKNWGKIRNESEMGREEIKERWIMMDNNPLSLNISKTNFHFSRKMKFN